VGIRFIRDMEQGKVTLRMDKVNQVLAMFGCELGPVFVQPEKPLTSYTVKKWNT